MARRRLDDHGGGQEDLGWPLLDSEAFALRQARALQAEPGQRMEASRWAMARSALELSGEVGYERMTVEGLIKRSGSNRDRFYRAYGSKAECYATGYSAAVDQLADCLLAAGADAPNWPAGFRQALEELAAFMTRERALAKGLLAEVYVAGEPARVKRKEVFERLSRAIDRARREVNNPRHSPPPITADFILSGIEAPILKNLRGDGGDFSKLLPGLLHIAVTFYFGTEAAQAEVRRLGN